MPLGQPVDAAHAGADESGRQAMDGSVAVPTATAVEATPAQATGGRPMPGAWNLHGALVPWLAALTLAVLVLLVRSFF